MPVLRLRVDFSIRLRGASAAAVPSRDATLTLARSLAIQPRRPPNASTAAATRVPELPPARRTSPHSPRLGCALLTAPRQPPPLCPAHPGSTIPRRNGVFLLFCLSSLPLSHPTGSRTIGLSGFGSSCSCLAHPRPTRHPTREATTSDAGVASSHLRRSRACPCAATLWDNCAALVTARRRVRFRRVVTLVTLVTAAPLFLALGCEQSHLIAAVYSSRPLFRARRFASPGRFRSRRVTTQPASQPASYSFPVLQSSRVEF